jgi:MinD-like ATPase involved in chromosome partitioning or flagellar assembly
MEARVGIIDIDIQSPGIHIILDFNESSQRYCLNDYLMEQCSIKEAVYDVSKNFDLPAESINLIPSRLNAEEIVKMLKEGFSFSRLSDGFSELIEKLRLNILLIDTHPGVEEETLIALAMSDILLIILRPDEQDYLGTAITLEIAKRMEVMRTFLIANRVPQEFDMETFRKNLEKTYNHRVMGILPFSYALMTSQSKELFCYTSPDDPFSVEMRTIAEKILAYTE